MQISYMYCEHAGTGLGNISDTKEKVNYQVSDDIITLLLEPNQDTRSVQTTTVRQDHRAL